MGDAYSDYETGVCSECKRPLLDAPSFPSPSAEDIEAARRDVSHDIAEYLKRFDCHNIDTTIDPIDLLRRVDAMMEQYDRELEAKDQLIEKLKAGETDELVNLRASVTYLRKWMDKIDRAPWIRSVLERMPEVK